MQRRRRLSTSLMIVHPHASPAERISERVLFVEEVIERVEAVGLAARRAGFFNREVGGEQPVGQKLRGWRDFVALVADMSIHNRGSLYARVCAKSRCI